jgi:uncharacterized protein YhaN
MDFAPDSPDFHVVYGDNEAGKSTALMAIRYLLYGFPGQTPYCFKHDNQDLRIGALLEDEAQQDYFCRRKGNVRTLLDVDGQVRPDEDLSAFLHGLPETDFRVLFGISNDDLVSGGKDILEGHGAVGEALFAAGTGAHQLRRVIGELGKTADALYRPNAPTSTLHAALAAAAAAKKGAADCGLRASQWKALQSSLREALGERDRLREHLRAARETQARMLRMQQTGPLVTQRRELTGQLQDLGAPPDLPDDFPERLQDARNRLGSSEETLRRETPRRQSVQAERDVLEVDDRLLLRAEDIAALRDLRGRVLGYAEDLPKREAEIGQLEEQIQAALSELSLGLGREWAAGLSALMLAKLDSLRQAGPALRIAADKAAEELTTAREALRTIVETIDDLPAEADVAPLEDQVARVLERGDLGTQLDGVRKTARDAVAEAEAVWRTLTPASTELEEVLQLTVPSAETIDRFRAQFDEMKSRQQALQSRLELAGQALKKHEDDLALLESVGTVPLEQDLGASRDQREEQWQFVRQTWLNGAEMTGPDTPYANDSVLAGAYEGSVGKADEVADAMRLAAERVARKAQLQTQIANAAEERTRLEDNAAELAEQARELEKQWQGQWTPSGLQPLPPAEMRSWLATCEVVRGHLRTAARLREEAQALTEQIAEATTTLRTSLKPWLSIEFLEGADLAALLRRTREVIAKAQKIQSQRQQLQADQSRLTRDLEKREREELSCRGEIDGWQGEFAATLEALGVPLTLDCDQAGALLAAVREIRNQEKDIRGLHRRVAAMQDEIGDYDGKVGALAAILVPDLKGLNATEVVLDLSKRLESTRLACQKKDGLATELERLNEILSAAEIEAEQSRLRLAKLVEEAGCASELELNPAWQACSRARTLRADLRTCEENLLHAGAGLTYEEIKAEVGEMAPDAIVGQLGELGDRITDLEEQLEASNLRIGGLERDEGALGGDESAQNAQEYADGIAAVEEAADSYVVTRLAQLLLQRQVEEYRRQNQAPMLRRASEMFSRLTLGSFVELDLDYDTDDQLVLYGRRAVGSRLKVSGMSDGTRDQLYLALRLASIEQWVAKGITMPLIVDDILIRFDDDRSRATLELLTELADHTQVIFFTHHARLVELGREVLGDGRLQLHGL